jgi:hypothetical protein
MTSSPDSSVLDIGGSTICPLDIIWCRQDLVVEPRC